MQRVASCEWKRGWPAENLEGDVRDPEKKIEWWDGWPSLRAHET